MDKFTFHLDIQLDDTVHLLGYAPAKVVEIDYSNGIFVIVDDSGRERTVDIYRLIKPLITVERTTTHVLTP
jgi:hypothetical protein